MSRASPRSNKGVPPPEFAASASSSGAPKPRRRAAAAVVIPAVVVEEEEEEQKEGTRPPELDALPVEAVDDPIVEAPVSAPSVASESDLDLYLKSFLDNTVQKTSPPVLSDRLHRLLKSKTPRVPAKDLIEHMYQSEHWSGSGDPDEEQKEEQEAADENDDIDSDAGTLSMDDYEQWQVDASPEHDGADVFLAEARLEAQRQEAIQNRREKQMQAALLKTQQMEANDRAHEEEEEKAILQSTEKLDEINARLLDRPTTMGDKVVFFDLEWHKLDKKPPADMPRNPKELSVLSAHICQLCAISSNYATRFNQYLSYRKLKEPWRYLVRNDILEFAPQDDPEIAMLPEDAFELFERTFQQKDILFLSYGNTDASSLFKSLQASHDYDGISNRPLTEAQKFRRREVLRKIIDKNWRFANAMTWIKDDKRKIPGMSIEGSLGRLYDVLFHQSLWLSFPTSLTDEPAIVGSEATAETLDTMVCDFPSNLDKGNERRFGLVPRDWIQVRRARGRKALELHQNCFPQFWPTKHLQPVFHVAHTDTIMLINCVAMLGMYHTNLHKAVYKKLKEAQNDPDKKKKFKLEHGIPDKATGAKAKRYEKQLDHAWANVEKKEDEAQFNTLSTSTIQKTWFFRKTQLALSEQLAAEIWGYYDAKDPKSKRKVPPKRSVTAKQMKHRVYVLTCVAQKIKPNKMPDDEVEDDLDLANGEYEVKAVIGYHNFPVQGKAFKRNLEGPHYLLEFVRYKEDWWSAAKDLDGSHEAIREFLSRPMDPENNPNHPSPEELAELRRHREWMEPPPPESTLQQDLKRDRSQALQKTLSKEVVTLRDAGERITNKIIDDEEKAEEEAEEFQEKKREANTYFLIPKQRENGKGDYAALVMTKRVGKFTDKVKAIRSFLSDEAKKEKDQALLDFLVQGEHPYHEKRKMRFPLDETKDYKGLPWFSLDTSVVEPRTEMLHTLVCRNLSDPKNPKLTRNFAEFDVFLWDFDIIIEQKMFINTRFRFCKECKEYMETYDPNSSGDPEVDALVSAFQKQRIISPPPPPSARKAPRRPAALPPPAPIPPRVNSVASSSSESTL